ncbi:MAG: hypothetical protein K5753_02125 [Clostridia bacterium]|nr:hypothetical protein [Clostridia bacterium]
MKPSGKRLSAAICLLFALILCLTAVFFACDGKVTLSLTLEGDLSPGSVAEPALVFSGAERKVKVYSEKDYVLSITQGEELASIADGKVKIKESATPGGEFTLRAEVGSLFAETKCRVAASPVEKVELVAPETAEAGETIALSARIEPSGAGNVSVLYELVSGSASISGADLTVSASADFGEEIVLRATAGGIRSEEKTVRISTIQPKKILFSSDGSTCLPGKNLSVLIVKEPENASFPIVVSVVKGQEIASFDAERGVLSVLESAQLKEEITLRATCGALSEEETYTVDRPAIRSIRANGGKTGVRPGETRSFSFTVFPEEADPAGVKISLVQGIESVEWRQGTEFTVYSDVEDGEEIVFLLEAGEDAYSTVTYVVERTGVESVELLYSGSASYLKCGETISLSTEILPATYHGGVSYLATEGEDLVTISGDLVTVKDGVGRGVVRIVAEALDGTRSNEIVLTVSGRYSRRAYSSWQSVSLATYDENECIWMVLPEAKKAGGITVVVPSEVKDLVIEGRYQGTEDTLYENLFFYFRNADQRTVTLVNFGTKATFGLGGTVLDLGSNGKTEIILEGANLVRADSPFYLDNSGEIIDGVWRANYSYASQIAVKRSGVSGHNGSAGGTAIAGFDLSFSGSGSLTAIAGDGTDGLAGGNGADAEYDETVLTYVSGAGGNGGAGGDSGAAIRAHAVDILSSVSAVPGNAGAGGKGGKAGSIAALAGQNVTATAGADGRNGPNGKPVPAIDAARITGYNGENASGRVLSRTQKIQDEIADITDKLARFYGIGLYYGTALYNPYKTLRPSKRYNMEIQTDPVELMRQANFLAYTLSQMPKNCWREIDFISGKTVSIYFAKSITSGSGSTILGLTSDANRVWFATFNTEIRGVLYSGYFNIMLHEFTHVFHYNFTSSARSAFESKLKSYNFGLSYSSYGSTERVYGVSGEYGASNSCFLSSYSRKTVMEDAAETASLVATLTFAPDFLAPNTPIRKKYECIATALAGEFETLSFTHVPNLFAYPYLY